VRSKATPARLKLLARKLRREETAAEKRLWAALRNHAVEGFRFRRQVILSGFIVNFACYEARLVLEIDGATHSTESEVGKDAKRDEALRANGNSVLRSRTARFFRTSTELSKQSV
jgi:very-short-patch-repair endonuclease